MKFKEPLKFIFLRKHLAYFHFPSETLRFLSFGKIFSSLFLVSKDDSEKFKSAIGKVYPGAKDIQLFNSGRMAMYTYLKALGLPSGSKVVVPPFTCDVVINAILYLGLKPIYCDINADNFGYDLDQLQTLVSIERPRVLIAQHSFGIPCGIEHIVELAKSNDVVVIEDCAHAFGVPFKGKRLGDFGRAAFFSTDQTKSFSTVLGGILVCNNPEDVGLVHKVVGSERVPFPNEKVVNLYIQQLYFKIFNGDRTFIFSQFFQSLLYRAGIFFDIKENGSTFTKPENYPMGMSDLQARWGHLQLEKLEENFSVRRTSVSQVEDVLGVKKYSGLPLLRYPLLVESRGAYRFQSKYFEIGNWFDCVALNRTGDNAGIFYTNGQCPVAESIHQRIVNIPLVPARESLYKKLLPSILKILN